jgi:hypothetical protein
LPVTAHTISQSPIASRFESQKARSPETFQFSGLREGFFAGDAACYPIALPETVPSIAPDVTWTSQRQATRGRAENGLEMKVRFMSREKLSMIRTVRMLPCRKSAGQEKRRPHCA